MGFVKLQGGEVVIFAGLAIRATAWKGSGTVYAQQVGRSLDETGQDDAWAVGIHSRREICIAEKPSMDSCHEESKIVD